MIHRRDAVVGGKPYKFILSNIYGKYTCSVYEEDLGGKFFIEFIYDKREPIVDDWKWVAECFDADIDALIAAGGTREAMARFVFGNMTEQKESRNEP